MRALRSQREHYRRTGPSRLWLIPEPNAQPRGLVLRSLPPQALSRLVAALPADQTVWLCPSSGMTEGAAAAKALLDGVPAAHEGALAALAPLLAELKSTFKETSGGDTARSLVRALVDHCISMGNNRAQLTPEELQAAAEAQLTAALAGGVAEAMRNLGATRDFARGLRPGFKTPDDYLAAAGRADFVPGLAELLFGLVRPYQVTVRACSHLLSRRLAPSCCDGVELRRAAALASPQGCMMRLLQALMAKESVSGCISARASRKEQEK